MNRTGLGLAIGAGYLLGRTKKLKLALAVGSVVAGKKLNLTPRALADLLGQQLRDNPQFKEIGDQLRQDLRGVGKAATGAMAERQMSALADRLHGRTNAVRDQLSGVVPDTGSEPEEPEEDEDEGAQEDSAEQEDEQPRREAPAKKSAAKKAPAKKAPAKKAPAKKAAAKSTAGRTAAKKTGEARRTATKKTATAGGSRSGGRSRQSKGGDDR
ncbi:DNA primase [Streptomyces sp. NPDC015414]|uniref:DNA primase n=1 Tax=Streptomyces sp. NPDC015414 TaxID=3364957 RepID=UPI0036F4E910